MDKKWNSPLLPSGATTQSSTAHKGGGNDKPGSMKEWLRNKLKVLASLLGMLGVKAAEALPGIIGQSLAGFSIEQKT